MKKPIAIVAALALAAIVLLWFLRKPDERSSATLQPSASAATTSTSIAAVAASVPMTAQRRVPLSAMTRANASTSAVGASAPTSATPPDDIGSLDASVESEERIRRLQTWAGRDYDAALAWASAQSDSAFREQALTAVCFALADKDPAAAVQMATSYHLSESTSAVMENLVQRWASADVNAAYAWVAAQSSGDRRTALLMRVAFVWAQTSPNQAAQMVIDQMPTGAQQTEAVMTVLHQWAISDAAGALDWVQRFPPGPLRTRAISELEGVVRQPE